ncbi:MAG: hypothetical protein ACRD3E_12585 [Terriglobales bacterium]
MHESKQAAARILLLPALSAYDILPKLRDGSPRAPIPRWALAPDERRTMPTKFFVMPRPEYLVSLRLWRGDPVRRRWCSLSSNNRNTAAR